MMDVPMIALGLFALAIGCAHTIEGSWENEAWSFRSLPSAYWAICFARCCIPSGYDR
jgi:hypothetical protein